MCIRRRNGYSTADVVLKILTHQKCNAGLFVICGYDIGMKAIDLTARVDDKAAEAITTTLPPQTDRTTTDS